MLILLKIRNLALVDQLQWELGEGLIAVTGETGAGKSVIVGALKMILGERADKTLIRTGEESCTVESIFQLQDPTEVNSILNEGGLDPCEDGEILIRRIISRNGNRQFINDSPISLGLLKRIGERLVDLHGPHDHQSLLSRERQLKMLDAYSGNHALLEKYREQYRIWNELQRELKQLVNAEEASDQELELLRYQLTEIQEASLTKADGEELEDRYIRSKNAARLAELTNSLLSQLKEPDGLQDRLTKLQRTASDLENFDSSLTEKLAPLETAALEIEELENSLSDYAAQLEVSPEEAHEIEERVNQVESLKRKYGPFIEDIIAKEKMILERLDQVENRSENIEQLNSKLSTARKILNATAAKLSKVRKTSAPKLAKDISTQLNDLGFKQSSFAIEVSETSEPGINGTEEIDFLFGPNPGEPLLPLREIGSSGEISRVMLAVKSSLAEQDFTPLMVFDEIDANVGGEIARAVGQKMARLGSSHQVISITHFPQVAAIATSHFVVSKQVSHGRTRSELFPVENKSRIDELVRMLGGDTGSEVREMANALLHQD